MTVQWTGAGWLDASAYTVPIRNAADIDAKDYGVVGDGSTDDTANANLAFTAGAAEGRVVNFSNMVVKITSDLTCAGPGFRFSTCSYGNSGDPGFLVSGTGFTNAALTMSGQPTVVFGTVYGTGNAVNGVRLSNPILARIQKLRVYKLAGYGVKINKCWDSFFHDISVEECGTTSEYAFSMNDDGDTCNMTHIGRLQVETANRKAIYISPNSLSCLFGNIHSEGLTNIDSSTMAYVFGGNSCQYNAMRVSASSSSCKVRFESYGCTYISPRIETADVELEGWSGSHITVITPAFTGAAHERASQTGLITIHGGSIASWTGSKTHLEYHQASWTPALKFGGGSTGMTYSAQSGTYTRRGNMITATFDFTLSAKGSSTGGMTITGLPWVVNTTHACTVAFYTDLSGVSGYQITGRADNGGSSIILSIVNADAAPGQLTDANFTDTSRVIGTITYQIA